MLHLIACKFKRTENSEWEKGYIITTDIDGQDEPGHIITKDGSIFRPDALNNLVWDITIQHHYGHFNLTFE